ncbi:Leucine-rich repeat protein kinase family protein [Melia azedarach]|uniref:Leucine-rich repeat protein kinase family protein n=1 Tax=Melia azedarach TaxID=155640 RepID=A0ACC1WV75_MELAZ|nr:Leucine-rich repeat protein kinase family protein [Melia azedarach]
MKVSGSKFFERFNSSSFLHSGLLPGHQNYTIKAVSCCSYSSLCYCDYKFPGVIVFYKTSLSSYFLDCFEEITSLRQGCSRQQHMSFSKNMVNKSEGVAIYKGILRDGTKVKIEIYREIHHEFVEECIVRFLFIYNTGTWFKCWVNYSTVEEQETLSQNRKIEKPLGFGYQIQLLHGNTDPKF